LSHNYQKQEDEPEASNNFLQEQSLLVYGKGELISYINKI